MAIRRTLPQSLYLERVLHAGFCTFLRRGALAPHVVERPRYTVPAGRPPQIIRSLRTLLIVYCTLVGTGAGDLLNDRAGVDELAGAHEEVWAAPSEPRAALRLQIRPGNV